MCVIVLVMIPAMPCDLAFIALAIIFIVIPEMVLVLFSYVSCFHFARLSVCLRHFIINDIILVSHH